MTRMDWQIGKFAQSPSIIGVANGFYSIGVKCLSFWDPTGLNMMEYQLCYSSSNRLITLPTKTCRSGNPDPEQISLIAYVLCSECVDILTYLPNLKSVGPTMIKGARPDRHVWRCWGMVGWQTRQDLTRSNPFLTASQNIVTVHVVLTNFYILLI